MKAIDENSTELLSLLKDIDNAKCILQTDTEPRIIIPLPHLELLLHIYEGFNALCKLCIDVTGTSLEDFTNRKIAGITNLERVLERVSPWKDDACDYSQRKYVRILQSDTMSIHNKATMFLQANEGNPFSLSQEDLTCLFQTLDGIHELARIDEMLSGGGLMNFDDSILGTLLLLENFILVLSPSYNSNVDIDKTEAWHIMQDKSISPKERAENLFSAFIKSEEN